MSEFIPYPQVSVRLMSVPDNATFTSGTPGVSGEYSWNYISLPQQIGGLEPVVDFVPQSFEATVTLNKYDIFRFQVKEPLDSRLAALLASAAQKGQLVCAWQILLAEGERPDFGSNSTIFGSTSTTFSQTGQLSPRDIYYRENIESQVTELHLPVYATRGGSGLIYNVRVQGDPDHTVTVTFEGRSWGALLENVVHQNFERASSSPLTAIRETFANNVVVDPANYLQRPENYVTTADGNVVGSQDGARATQIGQWCLYPAFAQNLGNMVFDDEYIAYYGQHSVLDTIQRIASQAGLVFRTDSPWIFFDAPNTSAGSLPNAYWGSQHISRWEINFARPAATRWIVRHNDYLRDYIYAMTHERLADKWGAIERSLISGAPRLASSESEPTVGTHGYVIDDEFIERTIAQQVANEAWRSESEYNVSVHLNWIPGSRWGIDWNPGDRVNINPVEVQENALLRPALQEPDGVIRPVVMQMTFKTTPESWSMTAGLGRSADLVPASGVTHTFTSV